MPIHDWSKTQKATLLIILISLMLVGWRMPSHIQAAYSTSTTGSNINTVTSQQVYVFSSGDATTDQAMLDIISAGGNAPTLGVEPNGWTGAEANLSQFNAVVVQNSHNWSNGLMPEAGQNSLVDYVQNGGGLITGEWFAWNFANSNTPINNLLPVTVNGFATVNETTYTVDTPDATINAGLPNSFTFSMANLSGSESTFQPKQGAISFYSSSAAAGSGLVGWEIGAGHVASFSNLLTNVELASNDLGMLVNNTLNWVAGESTPSNRIFLSKKVGLNGACDSYRLNVEVGTEVTYCYKVTNFSNAALEKHTLVDDQLGTLINDESFTIDVGGSSTFTATAVITQDVLNIATWYAEDAGGNVISDTAQAFVSIAETDLRIQKWVNTPSVVSGDELTYYIYYQNRSNVAAHNVLISDTLPVELSYIDSGIYWAMGAQNISTQHTDNIVSWTIPEVPAYSYGQLYLTVQLTDTVAVDDVIENHVTIESDTADSNLANNSYQYTVQVQESMQDLAVEKSVYGSPQPGNTLYYYIYYRNIGNQTINNVLITDTLPSNVTYVSHYDYYNASSMQQNGNQLVWTVDSLSPYQTGYIYLSVAVTDTVTAGAILSNEVTISGAESDIDLNNNTDVVTSTVYVPGRITGTVTMTDSTPIQYATAYAYQNNAPYASGWAWTDADGNYEISGLAPGDYYVYFYSQNGNEIYDNVTNTAGATLVTVASNQATPNINAQFSPPVPPLVTVNSGNNYVYVDPQTGQSSIWINRSNPSDLTISKEIICTSVGPTNVTLVFETTSSGTFEYQMTNDSGDSYSATIPAADLTSGTFLIKYDCDGTTVEEEIGHGLIDPSGYITDADTGEPIVGATVQLFTIDGWVPKDGPTDTRPNTCHTIDSRPSVWNDLPPAPQIGRLGNPLASPQEIDPVQNPLFTDDTGYYAWDVAAGCWYIVITAEGYETRVSPVVGVPPEVTDLDLTMNKIDSPSSPHTIYLPVTIR